MLWAIIDQLLDAINAVRAGELLDADCKLSAAKLNLYGGGGLTAHIVAFTAREADVCRRLEAHAKECREQVQVKGEASCT